MPTRGEHTKKGVEIRMCVRSMTLWCAWLARSGIIVFGAILLSYCTPKEQPKTPEEYLQAGNRHLQGKRQEKAREYYQELLEQFPESTYKAEAQFQIAEALYQEENYLEARFEYQKFLELYPAHALASRAQFQLGMCSFQTIQKHDRSQQPTQEALQAFRLLRRKYPQDRLVPLAEARIRQLRDRLAKREFAIARFYYRRGAYHAAIGRFLNLIQVYPTTPDLAEALYLLAHSYRAEENYPKAQRVLRLLVDRFPQSKYVARARAQLRRLPQTGIALQ